MVPQRLGASSAGHGRDTPVPVPQDEERRMAAVRRYDILDTPPDGAFDRVAALAARLLKVPVASVTIVDEDRIWFKAAHGLDGVSEIERDPGLCASAICQDGALVIPDTLLDPVACGNPLVTGAMGVRFYAAAPITTSDGYRLGTVNVLDTRPRLVTEDDTDTLADLAAIVMDELELRLSALGAVGAEQRRRQAEAERAETERKAREQAERDTAAITEFAATLQQTLLPPVLPAVPGMELACHYHPASVQQVGGDFYDVFPLGGDTWGFFLGDVCGKGATAAALTSLTRYTLRAAAHQHPDDPVAVLEVLNSALLLDPAVGTRFCTTLYGTLTPAGDGVAVRLGGGGHPPALHLAPDPTGTGGVRVRPVELPGAMLVGALPDARFAATTVHLAPGEALLLYTDGLTEARDTDGELLDTAGIAAMLAARTGPTTATAVVADTVAFLTGLPHGIDDDVALLALGVPTATGTGVATAAASAGSADRR
ncbi:SpoIIE family protein phosphatase [Saccharothrix sp. S26]|uniref:PP2C family protein-serine/threonine phosphatase n=1 Tax=Saccharothrix sp. S26 TaxID=2907215 RepID=UPI001F2872A2|nr:SpoIIE family protein phosphatase [Saccharothrix sp. S26]MCE6995552.1 SpoIIE family protein phosphatase [Saccharothrix sp. S26]